MSSERPKLRWGNDDCLVRLNLSERGLGDKVKNLVIELFEATPQLGVLKSILHAKQQAAHHRDWSPLVLLSTHENGGRSIVVVCTPREKGPSIEVEIKYYQSPGLNRADILKGIGIVNGKRKAMTPPVLEEAHRPPFVNDRVRVALR